MSPWLLSVEYPLPYPTAESHEIDGRVHTFWNEFRLRPSRFRFACPAMRTDNLSVLPCRLAIKHTLSTAEVERSLVSFVSAIPVVPDSDDPDHPGYCWHTPKETLESRKTLKFALCGKSDATGATFGSSTKADRLSLSMTHNLFNDLHAEFRALLF
jgi:hypothetical protein